MLQCISNEIKGGLYIDLLMTVRYSHEAWKGHVCSWRTVMKLGRVVSVRRTVMKLGRVMSVHSEQTQSRLLEKTHQSNGNLRKKKKKKRQRFDAKM